jgi:hypothetical protein
LTDVKISANEITPYSMDSMEEIEGSRSYHHPGTEFLRLHASTAGERLAGNAGRKTEIVFDTRTGLGNIGFDRSQNIPSTCVASSRSAQTAKGERLDEISVLFH